jgi:hypothetical protein
MPSAARANIARRSPSPGPAGKRDEAGEDLTAAAMMSCDMDMRV